MVTALVVAGFVLVASAAAVEKWSAESIPVPPGAAFSALSGISCPKPHQCIAVGLYSTSPEFLVGYPPAVSGNFPFAAARGATGWTLLTVPAPPNATGALLLGVSCPSIRECMAVGQYTTKDRVGLFTERWDGTQWQLQPAPVPAHSVDSSLVGVSCPAERDCTAVGFYAYRPNATFTSRPWLTLAEHWDGAQWKIEPTPNPVAPKKARVIQLSSVSCPAAMSCTAVGFYDSAGGYRIPFAEHLHRSRWTIESTPLPSRGQDGALTGVSCPSPGACTAIGNYGSSTEPSPQPLAESWSGSGWKLVKIPQPAGASTYALGVSCATVSDCTAVGYYLARFQFVGAWVERWNGSRWQIQSTPERRAGVSGYTSVSCPAPQACIAVGGTGDSLETVQPLGIGEQVEVAPVRGHVLYSVPASHGHFTPLTQERRIPVGSLLDTTRGVVSLTSADDLAGTETQTGQVHGGQFKVLQRRAPGAATRLILTGKLDCGRRGNDVAGVASSRRRHRARRVLWVNEHGGSWGTGTSYVATSVQGTQWLTDDTCTGTRVTVVQGVVKVTDLVLHRSILVHAGQSYLAGH